MLVIDPVLKMRNALIILAVIALTSCYTRHEQALIQPPDHLISKDTIVLILVDIEIAESALRQKQNEGHEIADMQEAYYHAIFTHYKISRGQYDSSMAYYRQDMEMMDELYERVITRLSVMESEIQME